MCRAVFVALLLVAVLGGCGKPPQVTLYEERNKVADTKTQFEAVPRNAVHVVARNDSLYRVANRYGLSTRALIDANGLKPPYRLLVGQRLKLPRPRQHKVVRGDTVYGISRRYNVALSQLVRLNRLKPPYTIIVGDTLRLPAAVQVATTKSATRTTANRPAVKPRARTTSRSAPTVKPRQRPAIPDHKLPAARGSFIWPLEGRVISHFGVKGKGLHNDGVNLAAPRGAPVRATQSGVVAYAGNELRGFGNLVLIRHANGIMSAYAHNDSLLVKPGDTVRKGQKIAKVGSTGSVETPQLHFEIRKGREALDPIRFIGKRSANLEGLRNLSLQSAQRLLQASR